MATGKGDFPHALDHADGFLDVLQHRHVLYVDQYLSLRCTDLG